MKQGTKHQGKHLNSVCGLVPLYHPSMQQSPNPLYQDDNNDMFSEGHEHLSKCYDDCQKSYISK